MLIGTDFYVWAQDGLHQMYKAALKQIVQDSRKRNKGLVLAVEICPWLYSLCNIAVKSLFYYLPLCGWLSLDLLLPVRSFSLIKLRTLFPAKSSVFVGNIVNAANLVELRTDSSHSIE
jgi:hypothetical protein